MSIKTIKTTLPGVLVFEPEVFGDSRGFFMEMYHENKYREAGLMRRFVQDNFSHSSRGILRGLHYQLKHPQGKLVCVLKGEVLDVAVDIRVGSPTFGQWFAELLSGTNRRQIFIPEGFAHGFCVLSESADFMYKCTDFYHPEDDRGVNWADKTINIDWPEKNPLLSDKDSRLPFLSDIPEEFLPAYR